MSMRDLAIITPFAFSLKCDGFVDAVDLEETNFQRLAFIIYKINASKDNKLTMKEVWRLRSDKSKANEKQGLTTSRSMEALKLFKLQNKL